MTTCSSRGTRCVCGLSLRLPCYPVLELTRSSCPQQPASTDHSPLRTRALAPTSSSASHLPSPPGPSARRSSQRTFVRSTPGGSGGGGGRNARLDRASAAFVEGGASSFERERERLSRGGGGPGGADEARNAEESAWSKVLDKEYAGKSASSSLSASFACSRREGHGARQSVG